MSRCLFLIILLFPNLLLGARGATSSPGGIIGAIGVILGFFFVFIMIADKSGDKKNNNQNIEIKKRTPKVAEIKNFKVKGTTKFSNGDRYIGEWKNDKKHGKGTYTFGPGEWEGDKYVGEYKNDLMHGQGTYIFKSGSKYIGQWKNNEYHGKGEFSKTDGTIKKGTWKNDKLNGRGTIIWADGTKYVGGFKDGVKEGRGTGTYADGTIVKGIWKKDKLVLDKGEVNNEDN